MSTHINEFKFKKPWQVETPFGTFTCVSKDGNNLGGHSSGETGMFPVICKDLQNMVICETYPNTNVSINYINNHANAVGHMEYRAAQGVARRPCRWNSKGKINELPIPDEALQWVGSENFLVGSELHAVSPSTNVLGGLCYYAGKPNAYIWVDQNPIDLKRMLIKKAGKEKIADWEFHVVNEIELHPQYGYFLYGNGVHNGQAVGFEIQYIKI